MKRIFNSKTLVRFVSMTFAISAICVAVRLIRIQGEETRSDCVLMLMQCVLGLGVMLLPGILQRKAHITIPSQMIVAYAIFMYCAVYLGEVQYFYFRVPHWDTMLHTFSGFALGAIGLSVAGLLNKSESVPLSPAFAAVFAFCFAVAAGAVWEIYEFAVDTLADVNMQKYMLESGEVLSGHYALADTMKDIIVDSIGAFVISAAGYVSIKRKSGWLERIQIKFTPPEPESEPVYGPVYELQEDNNMSYRKSSIKNN